MRGEDNDLVIVDFDVSDILGIWGEDLLGGETVVRFVNNQEGASFGA